MASMAHQPDSHVLPSAVIHATDLNSLKPGQFLDTSRKRLHLLGKARRI